MRCASLVLVVAGCYTPARPPYVYTPPPPVEDRAPSWDLDTDAAIAYALAHSPLLRDAADQEAVAEAQIGAAHQLSNPELHLGETSDDQLLGSTQRTVIALRLHPDNPWALDAKIAEARAGYDAQRATTEETRRALVAQVAQAYAQLAYGEAQRAILDREMTVIGERARVLGEQVDRATATRLELVLAREDVAEIDAARTALEVAAGKTRGQLARALGIPPGQPWKAIAALPRPHAAPLDRAALVARATGTSPDLAEAAARADAAGANAYQQRTARVPWLSALQVERSDKNDTDWAVSATISLPLFSLNSGKIAAAAAAQHRFTNTRARLADDLARRVTDAADLVEATAKRAVDLAAALGPEGTAIDELFAQEKLAAASDPVKLLLLEERYVRAQRSLLDAQYDHATAIIALEALVGGHL